MPPEVPLLVPQLLFESALQFSRIIRAAVEIEPRAGVVLRIAAGQYRAAVLPCIAPLPGWPAIRKPLPNPFARL